jgi:CheY-like chemotaxis protein
VLLLDIRMPGLDDIAATREIASAPGCAGVHVVILTTFGLDEYTFGALRGSGRVPGQGHRRRRAHSRGPGDRVRRRAAVPVITSRLIAEFAARTHSATPAPGLDELTSRGAGGGVAGGFGAVERGDRGPDLRQPVHGQDARRAP